MQSKKDSQNQYRTGVLIANSVEDRFGRDLIHKETDWKMPVSEARDKFDIGKTMYAAGRENHAPKPTTEDEIAAEEGYKEFEEKVYPKKGQPTHILFGHGASQDAFDKRDFGTTNELFFDKKMKTEKMINPHYYHTEKTKVDYFVTNSKIEDVPPVFKPKKKDEINAKSYNDFTKKFDYTYNKVGFRK
uniref:Uncharacterized protein n=1 Tax=Euplotes harpa TaxID=151035 RepID=A0A7S3JHV4_9SPIT|mmetsp:Transcript_38632/g.44261  ORF Transcript_38632/g.44261 Transcript_38632/m.44261 type:complete len:188 (+) Transcript_38632:18-581(+)